MKVLIAGDFAPRARLAKQICERDYTVVFPETIRNIVNAVDFSFVNLESPITESEYEPIPKCGPNLHCIREAAEAIKYAGFTGVTMANNHILDYGEAGLFKSVECCKNLGLDIVGVGKNSKEAANVLYLRKNSETLAIVNCCEHEFSIATENSAGANPLNPIKQYYAICEARKKSDYVVVIVHGGHEHFQLPSPRMQDTYRFFIDSGADVVVNHHQHCFSGYELYKGKPIFYGLGNFCFDISPIKNNSTWNYGFMLELTLGEKVEFNLHPYNQYGSNPTIELLQEDALKDSLERLNAIILDSERLNKNIEEYYAQNTQCEMSFLEPYSGRVMNKLLSLRLVPHFIKGKKLLQVLNHIDCESHRDKLIFALKNKNK